MREAEAASRAPTRRTKHVASAWRGSRRRFNTLTWHGRRHATAGLRRVDQAGRRQHAPANDQTRCAHQMDEVEQSRRCVEPRGIHRRGARRRWHRCSLGNAVRMRWRLRRREQQDDGGAPILGVGGLFVEGCQRCPGEQECDRLADRGPAACGAASSDVQAEGESEDERDRGEDGVKEQHGEEGEADPCQRQMPRIYPPGGAEVGQLAELEHGGRKVGQRVGDEEEVGQDGRYGVDAPDEQPALRQSPS
mmetsp:Transcript_30014/g.96848  ORF Transcript_30014/g.96848 Transcript_30014/m.96848 type:complete len:249 (-) Transcript_30014:344-1090(-)|eukprot:scaffold5417_cov129-Isochrysis_galbana.AAC.4